MSDKPFTLPAAPLPVSNPNMERQTGTGVFSAIKAGGWIVDGSKIKKGNIVLDSANERITIGPIDGNHVEIIGSGIRVYSGVADIPTNFVSSFEIVSIDGILAGIYTTTANMQQTFYSDQGSTADFSALPTSITGAVGDYGGTLTLSTRLATGGADISLMPPATGAASRVNVYTRLRVIPQSATPDNPVAGDLWNDSSGGAGTAKLKIYTGGAWVVVGTQT